MPTQLPKELCRTAPRAQVRPGVCVGSARDAGVGPARGAHVELAVAAFDADPVAEALSAEVDQAELAADRFGLSARERDVLRLLAEGRTSARIQEELCIAAGTVNYHTRNIYSKMGVHSRQELIDLVHEQEADSVSSAV